MGQFLNDMLLLNLRTDINNLKMWKSKFSKGGQVQEGPFKRTRLASKQKHVTNTAIETGPILHVENLGYSSIIGEKRKLYKPVWM